jgi:hypothetical protein
MSSRRLYDERIEKRNGGRLKLGDEMDCIVFLHLPPPQEGSGF